MSSVAQPYPRVSEGDEVEDVKERLRMAIRDARKIRSVRLRDAAAHALADVVLTIPAVADATCVSVYASRVTEPGTRPAARGPRRPRRPPAPARAGQRPAARLGGVRRPDDLRERAPGRPPEPGGPTLGAAALADADVVIAPALAVDTTGARLGQGGGWYDRALEHLRPGAPVVALVFPEELYDAETRPLPRERHDRLVDAVATPLEWHLITA